MNNSFKTIVAVIASTMALSTLANDVFTLTPKQQVDEASKRVAEAPGVVSKNFEARLKRSVLLMDSITVNLPHKSIRAKRMKHSDRQSDSVTPFVFENQEGFMAINKNINNDESIIIYDEEASQVFKGELDLQGNIEFSEIDVNEFICVNFDDEAQIATSEQNVASDIPDYYQNLDSLTLSQVTNLESRPGASKVLYIDYMAGTVTGTAWNSDERPEIVYDNYTYDSDASTFSLIDLQAMYAGWAETSEDYAPFDINVTTSLEVYNATPYRNKSKIIATSTNWRGSGGVAYVGVFGLGDNDFLSIGWTFNRTFGSLGATHSHESGHQMGLRHDGVGSQNYYSGHGNFGPIMGTPFGRDFAQWNPGDYEGANQFEDDLEIIDDKLGRIPDDHGDDNRNASYLTEANHIGLITPAGLAQDIDVFKLFLPNTQEISLLVKGLFAQENPINNHDGGINLSALIELYDSNGNLISSKSPSSVVSDNTFNYVGELSAGLYYLKITPRSYDSEEFGEYGNGGYYQIISNIHEVDAPDLLAENANVSEDTIDIREAFTFSFTARNAGLGTSAPTSIIYYRSDDADINDEDEVVSTRELESINAGSSTIIDQTITGPTVQGEHFYGACIIEIDNDLSFGNNCTAPIKVTLDKTIDLIAKAPQVNKSTLNPREAIEVRATVENIGISTALSGTLSFRRSLDSTISLDDNVLSVMPFSNLVANGSQELVIDSVAPITAGTYYLGACASSDNGDANDSNNCSSSIPISVRSGPDLEVPTFSASLYDNFGTGYFLQASITLENTGNALSGDSTVNVYSHETASFPSEGELLRSINFDTLSPSYSSVNQSFISIPNIAGTRHYRACVGAIANELDTTNNCSEISTLSIEPVIDYVVNNATLSAEDLNIDQPFNINFQISNAGNATGEEVAISVIQHSSLNNSSEGETIETINIASIARAAVINESFELSAPHASGSHFYTVCASQHQTEQQLNNNCSTAVEITVAENVDYVVDSVSVSQSNLVDEQEFDFNFRFGNVGNVSGNDAALSFIRHTDATDVTNGTIVTTVNLDQLGSEQYYANSVTLVSPFAPGNYYYSACATEDESEVVTNNNCSNAVQINVAERIDYLLDTASVSEINLNHGQQFTFSFTAKNLGNTTGPATNISVTQSQGGQAFDPAKIATEQTVDTLDLNSLSPNASFPLTSNLIAPTQAGTYIYKACINDIEGDSDASNNCTQTLVVEVKEQIDYVVESIEINIDRLTTEEQFTTSYTVRNQGNTSGENYRVAYYLHDQATSIDSGSLIGSDNLNGLASASTHGGIKSLNAPILPGTYYLGVCIDSSPTEDVTDNNCSNGIMIFVTDIPPIDADDYEPNDQPENANTIAAGETQNHSIHQLNDQDWLTFSLDGPAKNIIIETNGGTGDDTRLWLYNSDLGELIFNDDVEDAELLEANKYSKITIENLQAGTYYILVDEFANDALIRNYTLSLTYTEIEEDTLCFVIMTKEGKAFPICL